MPVESYDGLRVLLREWPVGDSAADHDPAAPDVGEGHLVGDADGEPADLGRELFAEADITREEYLGRKRALMASLDGGLPQPSYGEAVLVRAARLLADLGDLWAKATPTERAEIVAGLFAEVRVRDDRIISATPARDEYRLFIASATARAQVGVARPEGFGRARTTTR